MAIQNLDHLDKSARVRIGMSIGEVIAMCVKSSSALIHGIKTGVAEGIFSQNLLEKAENKERERVEVLHLLYAELQAWTESGK